MSCIDDRLRQVRLKCRQQSESQTSLESCVNSDSNNKVAVLMKYRQEMKNILKLINEKKDKSKIKLTKNIEKHQNSLKELNIRHQENKILEEYISDAKNHIKTIETIKHENDHLQLVHKKNTAKICQLKEEMVSISRLSLNSSQPILLDSDDDFMGFDSVTVSKSESHISSQNKSYRSLYCNIQKNSDDFQNFVNSLMNEMKKTNSSMQNAVTNIDSVTSQIIHDVTSVKKQLLRILHNDQEFINELTKKRSVLEQIKLNSFCHLSLLESDIVSLGNREETKRFPTINPYHNYCLQQLKKLSVRQLFLIWTEMILSWRSYHYNHENGQY